MNKVFTSDKVIALDKFWTLTPDSDNGIILTFSENRQRDKVEKINGKKVKTGEVEDYLFVDKFYTPRIAQSLRIYAEKTLNSSKTLEEIIEKEDKIFELIGELDRTFKQFN